MLRNERQRRRLSELTSGLERRGNRAARTAFQKNSKENAMKALVWHGKEDIRCDTVTDPEIEDPRDAIVRVTTCAICGSDLHLFHNMIPAMLPGDIIGHEMMGEVVETGRGVSKLRKGERVVIPFTINCDRCDQCRRGNYSLCERSNRKK